MSSDSENLNAISELLGRMSSWPPSVELKDNKIILSRGYNVASENVVFDIVESLRKSGMIEFDSEKLKKIAAGIKIVNVPEWGLFFNDSLVEGKNKFKEVAYQEVFELSDRINIIAKEGSSRSAIIEFEIQGLSPADMKNKLSEYINLGNYKKDKEKDYMKLYNIGGSNFGFGGLSY